MLIQMNLLYVAIVSYLRDEGSKNISSVLIIITLSMITATFSLCHTLSGMNHTSCEETVKHDPPWKC